ncbi:site-specific integrase [uncultured Imperialibacter sp.]|uniref:site-specific integrase n=1 Tax=uncultured Imperialibacter sp. TaxID=1672639 RepID=UPI0030D86F46|tara:strand:+ start:205746 stop:206927 length:1182 start_codon:yes stop_codon:yes gene_type:complete
MGYSISALVNRSNRKNKSGLYVIQIRVTINRKSKYFSLEEKVDLSSWSGRQGKWVKESHPHNHHINNLISNRINEVYDFIYNQKRFGHPLSLDSVETYLQKSGNRNIFNDYVKSYIREFHFDSLNTVKKYRTFDKHLDEFNPQIPFSALNENLFQAFAQFLSAKGLTGITVIKYFDPFKKVCKKAIKEGLVERDPFYGIELGVKPTKSKRVYLEIEEIVALRNAKVPAERPDLEETRTHWLFCFYSAFYYSDLRKLEWGEMRSSDQGYVIVGDRYKNEEGYISPVHKFTHATEIIEAQKGKDSKFVFPGIITEQKFNGKLKEVAALAGIDKNLTNKMARHSAVQFWEAQGLETQHTAKIVGHTNERTTKSYYELSIRDINSRVDKFDFSKLGL